MFRRDVGDSVAYSARAHTQHAQIRVCVYMYIQMCVYVYADVCVSVCVCVCIDGCGYTYICVLA